MSKGRTFVANRAKESKRLESKIERDAANFQSKHNRFVPPQPSYNPTPVEQSNKRDAHFFRAFEKGSLR